jgi:uncharacterized membrane protein YhhN
MRALISVSVVVSCFYLVLIVSHHANGSWPALLSKVASIALLVAVAASSHPRSKLLVAALAFSAGGDFLLEVRHLGSLEPEQLFLFGLISFLIAHLFYVGLFLTERSFAAVALSRKIDAAAVLMVAGVSMAILWPGLAEMRIPVALYSAVLSAMVITAQLSRFPKLVAIGALFFLASDTMLALSIFGHPFAGSRILVWITYYGAQWMITVGVTAKCKGSAAAV